MKKLLLAGISFAAVIAGPAMAADLARPAYVAPARVAYAPVASWTGLYAGVSAGYGWSHTEVDPAAASVFCNPFFAGAGCAPNVATNAQLGALPPTLTTNPKGGVIGGQLGYNYQFGSAVAGVETDLSWTNMNGSGTAAGTAPVAGFPFSAFAVATADQRLKYFGTVRGRLGYLVSNPLLVYATGGLAYGGVNSSTTLSDIFVPGAGFGFTPGAASATTTRVGWTAGGGLEYLLAGNWSLKGEYLYYDLGSTSYALSPVTVTSLGITATNLGVTSTADFKGSIVRFGLNYKFGGAAAAAVYK